nr:hypothetical protein [Tanacetum cinerariifolium]
MKSIQTFLEKFNCIPFEEKPKILLQAWYNFFAIRDAQPKDSNELFQKLLEDLKELAELLLINSNSQHLDKKKQEVKNVVEQPAERGTLIPILSTKEPEYSLSMGYEHPNTTLEMESDEIIKSGVEELVPIPNECKVTSRDKRKDDVLICENSPICDNHSDILSDSNNGDGISSDDDTFEDIEYVDATLPDLEIVSVEEENVVHQQEEEFDLEEIQDIVLRETLLSIN